eukprot:scaffold243094_cov19-Tisochrysis_lutea.AAC.1
MARRVCGTGVTAILWLKRSCCWTPTYKTHSCCCSCGSLLARVIAGKGGSWLFPFLMAKYNLNPERTAMVECMQMPGCALLSTRIALPCM